MRFLLPALLLCGARLWADPLIGLPPAPALSPAGYQLILDYEVGGGRAYFERRLARPTWPGAASGVTIGVGYDLGYNRADVIRADWRAVPARDRLAAQAGITGKAAKARVASVHDILIEWGLAEDVFNRVSVAKFWQITRRTVPGFDDLHPNAQAALLSLGFNRGWSLAGPARVEMREIVRLAPRGDYRGMAAEIRKMKRLWAGKGLDGLLKRREAEARLMEGAR